MLESAILPGDGGNESANYFNINKYYKGAFAPTGTCASMSDIVVAPVLVVVLTKSTHSCKKWDVTTASFCACSVGVNATSTHSFKMWDFEATSASLTVRGASTLSMCSGWVCCRRPLVVAHQAPLLAHITCSTQFSVPPARTERMIAQASAPWRTSFCFLGCSN